MSFETCLMVSSALGVLIWYNKYLPQQSPKLASLTTAILFSTHFIDFTPCKTDVFKLTVTQTGQLHDCATLSPPFSKHFILILFAHTGQVVCVQVCHHLNVRDGPLAGLSVALRGIQGGDGTKLLQVSRLSIPPNLTIIDVIPVKSYHYILRLKYKRVGDTCMSQAHVASQVTHIPP